MSKQFIGDRRIHNRWEEEVGVCHEMVEHLRRGSGARSPLGRGDALRRQGTRQGPQRDLTQQLVSARIAVKVAFSAQMRQEPGIVIKPLSGSHGGQGLREELG